MKTEIELQEQILSLQNELKKYNKIEYSLERLTNLLKVKQEELSILDKEILDKDITIQEQDSKISKNNISIEKTDKEVKELTRIVEELGMKSININKYLGGIKVQTIDAEKTLEEVKEDFRKTMIEIEEYDEIKRKELDTELSIIQNKIIVEEEKIVKIKEDVEKEKQLLIKAKESTKEQNIKIQTNNSKLYNIQKEEEKVTEKITALKDEMELMLKEGKKLAIEHKVVKSWTTRLDKINNKFIG